MLDECQQEALAHVASYAMLRKPGALERLNHVLEMSDISPEEFSEAVDLLKTQARVALHFHPDRSCAGGQTVLESLLESGLYKSQFETLISAGSVTAWPGGHRFGWEDELFAEAYSQASAEKRPKYGALHLLHSPDGPAPRFGSCFFLLKPRLSQRCTFTYLDSHLKPPQRGTLAEFDDVLAALFTESFERQYALGRTNISPRKLLESFLTLETKVSKLIPSRNLDHYIEAQVHGPVSLQNDAEQVVADPSFRGTEIGDQLERMADRYNLEIRWHGGFRLPVKDVPKDFRGPVMPRFAARVAGKRDWVDARILGQACHSQASSPGSWDEFGEAEQVSQLLKRLWHVVLRFGEWA